MRVLVASLPFLGHALPTELVVRALVRRGHAVTWLTGASAEAIATRAGATFRPLAAVPSSEPAALADWLQRLKDAEQAQANDCHGIACDVVLADPTMLGVHAWAGETQTPLHILGILPFLGISPHAERLWHASIPDFEPWRQWHGLPVTFTGPLLVKTAGDVPPLTEQPRIVITQGTLAREATQLYAPAKEACAPLPVEVVTTETWRPLHKLLDGAALLITNGGYGGIQAALAAGVPVLVAGDTEEKAENGRRVEYAGIGGYLPAPYTPDRIREAMRFVLDTPRFRERAQQLQGRMIWKAEDIIAAGVTQVVAGRRAA